jgi:hypothetical protein
MSRPEAPDGCLFAFIAIGLTWWIIVGYVVMHFVLKWW